MSTVLDRRAIEEILPHKGIALVLDSVEIIDDKRAVGLFTWPASPYTDGHFPGNPVIPGHWIKEFAILVVAVLGLSTPDTQEKFTVLLGQESEEYYEQDGAEKYRGFVKPGQTTRAEVELTTRTARGVKGNVIVFVNDTKVQEFKGIFGTLVDKSKLSE